MFLSQKYKGALLFGDASLFVINLDTNEKKSVPIGKFNNLNKANKYRSLYKGMKGQFKIIKNQETPLYRYEVVLTDNRSFTCGINHKVMVYRNIEDNMRSSELLPIEFLFEYIYSDNKKKTVYIPCRNETDSSSIDMMFTLVKSIHRTNNNHKKPVYGIVFAPDSPSILMALDNGIIIRGDKESNNIITNVKIKHQNTI
jgi:hypothetical protein